VVDRAILRSELKSIIATMLELEDFRDDAHFMRDLRADSMLLSEIAVSVERRFNVQVPDTLMREVRCLNDAVRVVAQLLKIA
jgi:acyl carrier protein